ncbi:MAG: hypothetical protein BZ138_00985 [Methanosphaera sp. rholeuAM270]|nr:MAG: hypothetical protein BZ138_00985 [Methanosphaera sp. rholeuAM270]
MSVNIFKKSFLKEYLSRNKNLILLSLIIFILSIIIGAVFSSYFKVMATQLMKRLLESIPMKSVSENAVNLFKSNLTASMIIILGGLIFSITSVLAIMVNGILIGYVSTLINPVVYLVGVIPHGIFELTALILSLTGAFILTKIEIRIIQAIFSHSLHSELENTKILLKDLVFTVLVSFVLLAIAAIIEAAITPIFLSMVV